MGSLTPGTIYWQNAKGQWWAAGATGSSLYDLTSRALHDLEVSGKIRTIPTNDDVLYVELPDGRSYRVTVGTVRQWHAVRTPPVYEAHAWPEDERY